MHCTTLPGNINFNRLTAGRPRDGRGKLREIMPGSNRAVTDCMRSKKQYIMCGRLRESARFWHQLWTDSGCPSSGVLFQIKRNAKHRFKYEVRRLKRRREHIIRDNIGNALSHSRHKDFWKEVRKLSRSTRGSRSNAPVIDGLSDPLDISHAFSSKLKDILNSHHLSES